MGEPVSQSKIFIDFGGSAAAVGGVALPGGNRLLKRVKTLDDSAERDLEVVTAIGVAGGAGYREKQGGGTLALEVFRETGTPEVDWRALWNAKTTFTITVQDELGSRESYLTCRVANVVRKDDDAGSHMDNVKVMYLRYVTLAAAAPVAL